MGDSKNASYLGRSLRKGNGECIEKKGDTYVIRYDTLTWVVVDVSEVKGHTNPGRFNRNKQKSKKKSSNS